MIAVPSRFFTDYLLSHLDMLFLQVANSPCAEIKALKGIRPSGCSAARTSKPP